MGEASSRQARHQASRRARGLCAYGGCKVATDKYRCPLHAQEHAQMMRDRREPAVVAPAPVTCACGAPETAEGACDYFKSGVHQFTRAAA